MLIVQIIPQYPEPYDGIADHALVIARALKTNYDIDTEFLIADKLPPECNHLGEFKCTGLTKCSSPNFAATLLKFAPHVRGIILHYVGYGYQKRGAPIWLIRGLNRFRTYNSTLKLVTFFHETWANGAINSSAFWLRPLQINLVRSLLQMSTCFATSLLEFKDRLEYLSENGKRCLFIAPVTSTIGEPKSRTELAHRMPQAVLFGSTSVRKRICSFFSELDGLSNRGIDIEQIIEVGDHTANALNRYGSIPVQHFGALKPAEVSELLKTSRYGILCYRSARLDKSSVFMAYVSHGCLPIVFDMTKGGLRIDDADYIDANFNTSYTRGELEAIAKKAFYNYRTHDTNTFARYYSEFFHSK